MEKIKVEFFSTCPGWRADERLVVAVTNKNPWKERVDLKIYHLDRDPAPAQRYQPILGATVVINRSTRITRISADSLQRALEAELDRPRKGAFEGE